jgi:hypothetical protein
MAAMASPPSGREAGVSTKTMTPSPEAMTEGPATKIDPSAEGLLRDPAAHSETGRDRSDDYSARQPNEAKARFQLPPEIKGDGRMDPGDKPKMSPPGPAPAGSGSNVVDGMKESAGLTVNDDSGLVSAPRSSGGDSVVSMTGEPLTAKTASVAGSGGSQSPAAPTETFRQENFHQLVEKALFTVRNGQSEARIALKPDQLGHVQMKIVTENNHVSIRIVTESTVARDLIDGSAHQLKAELQQQGLSVESIEVSVSDEQRDAYRGARQREEMLRQFASRRQDAPEEEEGQPRKQKRQTRRDGRTAASGIDYFA